jgi:2,3-bisphosphoglycerate-dependent phosphoglycerate mutase
MNCKLFVFRHSETFDNSRAILSGWRDSTLTPKGIIQAETISKQLKHYKIDYAFTSHLKRAKQTLEIVLKSHTSTILFTDDRLMERCYGLWQGRKKKEIEDEDSNCYEQCHRGYNQAPPDGESLKMVEKRVISFLNEFTGWLNHNPGNVAISCHNNSIRPLRRRFENLNLGQMCKLESVQDRAMIYTIQLETEGVYRQKSQFSQTTWNGVIVPKAVRLATDIRNPLKTYYS